jgi:hypothetical protein
MRSVAQGGRERLRPNRGFPATRGQCVNPHKRTAARCSAEKIQAGAPSPNSEPSMNRSFRSTQRVICVGSCVFQGRPGNPGSDGASPYRLKRRFIRISDNSHDPLWPRTRSCPFLFEHFLWLIRFHCALLTVICSEAKATTI